MENKTNKGLLGKLGLNRLEVYLAMTNTAVASTIFNHYVPNNPKINGLYKPFFFSLGLGSLAYFSTLILCDSLSKRYNKPTNQNNKTN